MIAVVRRTVLRVSSASMAQHSPAHAGAGVDAGASPTGTPSAVPGASLVGASLVDDCPAGVPTGSGQCTSPSGRCSRSGTRLPIRARRRRSLRQYAPAAAYPGADSSAIRTAVTARRCARRASAGGDGRYGSPQARSPARVSQTQGRPGPRRAESA